MVDPTVGFVGAGTLDKGLALALNAYGYRVVVSSRSPASAWDLAARIPGCEPLSTPQEVAARCELVVITTPDESIGRVAAQVRWWPGQGVVHCSGARSMEVLEPVAALGAVTGSLHPFQTFACLDSPEEAVERFNGIVFAVEGAGWLLDLLKDIASRLGGRALVLKPEDRSLYHASAVMSCGYLVALLKASADLWREMGLPTEEALSAPLSHSSQYLGQPGGLGVRSQCDRPPGPGRYRDPQGAPGGIGSQTTPSRPPLLSPGPAVSAAGQGQSWGGAAGCDSGNAHRIPVKASFAGSTLARSRKGELWPAASPQETSPA